MSKGKTILIATGALGGAAGIGYLIARSRSMPDGIPVLTRAEAAKPPRPAADGQVPIIKPLPGPKTPLVEPAQLGNRRLTHSHVIDGIVQETPYELMLQALPIILFVGTDELAAARLAASEHMSGSFTELACIVDAQLNRAARRGGTLLQSITTNGRFGKPDATRPWRAPWADPWMRHVQAAKTVFSGKARGVSRGAIQFFDPLAMEWRHHEHRKWVNAGRIGTPPYPVSCDPLMLLELLSFDYGRATTGDPCPPDRSRQGPNTLAWVGPIDGVDPVRLLLMKPMARGVQHRRRYEAAYKLIQRGVRTYQ